MQTPSEKPDYPPLLPIGRHPFTVEELRALCVTNFPLSTSRPGVMHGLESVIQTLTTASVQGELWIDGSFLTEKIKADDSDVVLVACGEFYDTCEEPTRAAMDWLNGNLYDSHRCDSYLHLEHEESAPNYWLGEYMHAYWMKQWGFSKGGVMKGIAVIQL